MSREEARAPARSTKPNNRKSLVVILVALLVLAALGGVGYTLIFAPRSPIGSVAVVVDNASIDQGQVIIASASLLDYQNVDQTRNATFTWSADPISAVKFISRGTATFRVQIKALEPGNITLTATGTWSKYSKQGQLRISARPVGFEVRTSNVAPVLGERVVLTVTAVRTGVKGRDRFALGYNGTVNLTADDPNAATLPPNAAISPSSVNRSIPGLVIKKAGPVRINARDTVAPISGSLVLMGDTRPVPVFFPKANPLNPLRVTFDASPSFDPDNHLGDAIVDYEWNFGDKTVVGSGQVVTHTYARSRVYSVTLTVTDSHQNSNSSHISVFARSPLIARFATIPMIPSPTGYTALVNASLSVDPNGTIMGYNWTWGDGSTDHLDSPVAYHNFSANQVDQQVTISLEAWDDSGLKGMSQRILTVTSEARPPTASFQITLDDQVNLTVVVDGANSTDDNGDIRYYNWSWGDGNYSEVPWYESNATHVYGQDNYFNITLTVSDSTGSNSSATKPVRVIRPTVPPVAVFLLQRTLLHVDVDASRSHDLNNNIANYTWDWGDGRVSGPYTSPQASHDYAKAGRYNVTLTVTDTTNLTGATRRTVSMGPSTIDYTFYDFFNVPYGEWWDIRQNLYYDTSINANCFNKTSIDEGICKATDPSLPAYETYPYTNWYPLVGGSTSWGSPSNIPFVYAPYRWRAVGMNVPGYTLGEPVFLPVMNYSQAPGSQLDFHWYMQYLTTAEGDYLTNVQQCPGVSSTDGYYIRSQIHLTMDLQESKRIFGVPVNVTDQQAANWWWHNQTTMLLGIPFHNIEQPCYKEGIVEMALEDWFVKMGGSLTTMGKYDIENGYEWYYTPFYTKINVTVDSDGTTHVNVDHAAWGTEVLLGRMMFWGNTSYRDYAQNWTRAKGWWGMETAWFEDLTFQGSLGVSDFDFTLDTAEQYHFQLGCDAGTNGVYDHIDDRVYWSWGPTLDDYLESYSPGHTASEFVPYVSKSYYHCMPGGQNYGAYLPYDYVPASWDLSVGQTWHFQFPTVEVVFYDPDKMTAAKDPRGGFVAVYKPLTLYYTNPGSYGEWNNVAKTWEVYGPASTGGEKGLPPSSYPEQPWGAIYLRPEK